MKSNILVACSVIAVLLLNGCNDDKSKNEAVEIQKMDSVPEKNEVMKPVAISEMPVKYSADGVSMVGFAAYDSAKPGKRPIVLIVHEWWGLNEYTRTRARQLAELGYFAVAVDMYGNGTTADNPAEATKLSTPFYKDADMARNRFVAALNKAKSFEAADPDKVAAIGYCFGGAQVVNMAKLGEKLNAVVSFHGNLTVLPTKKDLLTAPILVCHGESDQFVKSDEVALFKKQMDSVGATYIIKSYPGAMHAFTNPNATAVGEKFKIPIAYNAAADKASWEDMKSFFEKYLK